MIAHIRVWLAFLLFEPNLVKFCKIKPNPPPITAISRMAKVHYLLYTVILLIMKFIYQALLMKLMNNKNQHVRGI